MSSVRPFSTGSEYSFWQDGNCVRCVKHDPDSLPTCELEKALWLGYIVDGEIPVDVARRFGAEVDGDDKACYLPPHCPEIVRRDDRGER